MRSVQLLSLALLAGTLAYAQNQAARGPQTGQPPYGAISVRSVEKLRIGGREEWSNPQFSPDGAAIFVSGTGYGGIWRYDLARKTVVRITDDPGSGFGFAVSADGRRIAYRRTVKDSLSRRRFQEAVIRPIEGGSPSVIGSGRNVSLPVFVGETPVASVGQTLKGLQKGTSSRTTLLGIENTKIAVLRGGTKALLDPLGNGSYIWPSMSPDGKRIVACEVDRGAFVCDLAGKVLARLGRRNAPSWTRDGRWIVYMDDRDDGHRLLESDLHCVSADGKKTARLTSTRAVLELNPSCSRVDNRIVYGTPEGDLYILTYEETDR